MTRCDDLRPHSWPHFPAGARGLVVADCGRRAALKQFAMQPSHRDQAPPKIIVTFSITVFVQAQRVEGAF